MDSEVQLATGEAFRDAFYSFDAAALDEMVGSSPSAGLVTFYQGWAEAANYTVVEAIPCELSGSAVKCSTTVEDDFMKALAVDFNVTDTFHISIGPNGIGNVSLTSDDPPESREAFDWMSLQTELLGDKCAGFFGGGPTPDECALAYVAGFATFNELEGDG